jgi:probable HAF family extracellular repeat protein
VEGIAYAINNKGQVVGASDTTSGVRHAFVYYKHQMLDLNNLIPTDSNFVLTRANGINKRGKLWVLVLLMVRPMPSF